MAPAVIFLMHHVAILASNGNEDAVFSPVDFGVVQSGEIVSVTARLEAPSYDDLQIERVLTSCSCFIALTPIRDDAAKCVWFPVRIDTAGRVGETTQTLFVHTNQGVFETQIHGEVRQDVQSAPSSLSLSRSRNPQQGNAFHAWSSTHLFRILEMAYDSELLSVTYMEEDPQSDAMKQRGIQCAYVFTVQASENLPERLDQPIQTSVIVKTDSPYRPTIVVEITLREDVLPILSFQPSTWIYHVGEEAQQEYIIQLRDEQIQIEQVFSTVDWIDVQWESCETDPLLVKAYFSMEGEIPRKVSTGHVTIVTNAGTVNTPLLVLLK